MRMIVGGKFEAALIHELDEINNPQRNRTTHPYYLGLNRKTDRRYFERLSTFLAIAEKIVVPMADWSDRASANGVPGVNVGLLAQTGTLNEWDEGGQDFAEQILKSGALADETIAYISGLDLSALSRSNREDVEGRLDDIKSQVSIHYLCRLFLQVREAGSQGAILILDEEDIRILSQIGDMIREGTITPPFAFPDISDKVILGSDFAGGLFNFSPRDMRSVAAIRCDPEVEKYAVMVRKVLGETASLQTERELLHAMRASYKAASKHQKIDKAMEAIGWMAKPFHYVPGIDAALSIAEDAKDIGKFFLDRSKETKEWHLLAVRATQINIEEYFSRKENL